VEVRQRSSQKFGGAAASVTTTKQGRIIKAAQIYLQQKSCELPCRFDVVLIDGEHKIEWLKNAFET
jgi:putative endonuclease